MTKEKEFDIWFKEANMDTGNWRWTKDDMKQAFEAGYNKGQKSKKSTKKSTVKKFKKK